MTIDQAIKPTKRDLVVFSCIPFNYSWSSLTILSGTDGEVHIF